MVFLENDLIELRLMDYSNYLQTQEKLNNQCITKYMQHGIYPISLKAIEKFNKKTFKNGLYLAIYSKNIEMIRQYKYVHVGNIVLTNIHLTFRFADMSILIWCPKQGYGTNAVKLVSDHAFSRINIHRLGMGTASENIGCIKIFEKNGFTICGVLKDYYFFDGKYQDVVLMEKIKNEK